MVKTSWTNFRAYHNTYYNLKKAYGSGMSRVEGQPSEIDPGNPIRIDPLPTVTGEADFENVVVKGNRLLRDFPESKWVDETMELVGQSYYYLHEFYPALQQFENLSERTGNPELRQRAVAWKGRALFDLGVHEEGVFYLENELNRTGEWETDLRGDVELILAEHHIQLGNREEAVSILRQALGSIERGGRKARAFFLLGQLLEIMGRYGEAEYAYSRSQENLPGFDLMYFTNMRKAGVLRKREEMENALEIYRIMVRDDKYLEQLPQINYEIARTEEEMGNYLQAELRYKTVLKNVSGLAESELLADTYFRLGRIYSDVYEQFQLAAAYFDSADSGTLESSGSLFAEIYETNDKAGAWREYSLLRRDLAVVDSLLWLGSLTVAEERHELKDEQAGIRYALGSLLMLTLDRPERSVPYFRSVIEEHPNHTVVPAALYSLFEIYFTSGDLEEAEIWGSRLRRSYPETIFAQRVDERLGGNMESRLFRPN